MRGNRLTLFAVAAALTFAGCGGDDDSADDAGAGTTATAPATTAPGARGETAEPAPETGDQGAGAEENGETAPGTTERATTERSPGRGCLTGTYVSSSFAGKRSFNSPVGSVALSGRGRGLGLTFSGASAWTMRGVGGRPMRGKVYGIEGTLVVNGSVRGRLIRAPGGRLRFRQTGSRGTVTLSGLGQSFELPVDVVAPTVVPDGRAKVTCSGDRLTIASASGVLRLTRP